MAFRAVVFDIGGVLELNTNTALMEIVGAQWEQRLGLSPGELERRMKPIWQAGSLGNCTEEEVHQELEKRLGMSEEQVAEYMRVTWDWYCGSFNVPMADFFRSLRPRYRTALLSNSFVGARRQEQERYHYAEMCDLIIYSHEVGVAKPERRIYELTCERLGVQPAEMLFLDDSPRAVEGARVLGIHALLFQNTQQAIAEIEAALRQ